MSVSLPPTEPEWFQKLAARAKPAQTAIPAFIKRKQLRPSQKVFVLNPADSLPAIRQTLACSSKVPALSLRVRGLFQHSKHQIRRLAEASLAKP
ncbi:hypothetical protein DSO57_1039197 [Entomophthora muscae]|uniref:Uncharacterized protein n=2 Tax=Entomophthora muscae TaxID=34485 RepID=A0ACC2RVY1_9FUNG|nr:hypothetical protein DSO57_1017332 [Entomophthora muscae]KAJ9055826.1 hypothetical protein DSO57_1039197 [Entomophthora muscae]